MPLKKSSGRIDNIFEIDADDPGTRIQCSIAICAVSFEGQKSYKIVTWLKFFLASAEQIY